MSKGKRSRRRGSSARSNPQIQQALDQADRMIEAGKPLAAVELLQPLVSKYPRNPDLHHSWGYANVKAGNTWEAVAGYQKALQLQGNPDVWVPLGSLYLELSLRALALRALRRIIGQGLPQDITDWAILNLNSLEDAVKDVSEHLNLTVKAAERGLRFMDEGQIALNTNNYQQCIQLNRKAINILGEFPPPHNNLSLALFFSGRPIEAVRTAQGVLENDPDNIQALANLVRFLTWTTHKDQAHPYWERLKGLNPENPIQRQKMIEAAAIFEDDQQVYRMINELESIDGFARESTFDLYLAIAEANLGIIKPAQRKLNRLKDDLPRAGQILEALREGQRGLGWSRRFPYHHATSLLPRGELWALFDLFDKQEEISVKKFRREVDRFASRFPQIVLVGKKLILEEQKYKYGIDLLTHIGTPEAYAALRDFGLSQAGTEEARNRALFALYEAGQIDPDETLRIWKDGEWREVQLRRYDITEEPNWEISDQALEYLDQGHLAFQQGKYDESERLFERVLEIDPGVTAAYNNLGAIYSQREEHERAKEMYQEALRLDPLYPLPRCNLASYLLEDKKLEEAQAMIAPLDDIESFTPHEMAFLAYIRARIAVHMKEYDLARTQLEIALQVNPDMEIAQDMLDHLTMIERLQKGFGDFIERSRQRDKQARLKLQKALSTADPGLSEGLDIYIKDNLYAMGHIVIPEGGWSTLRKGDLRKLLVENLQKPEVLVRLVSNLEEIERQALRQVLDQGGSLLWDEFESAYDHDLDESRHWKYRESQTIMGRLRRRGLLVEATVDDQLLLAVPVELREPLGSLL